MNLVNLSEATSLALHSLVLIAKKQPLRMNVKVLAEKLNASQAHLAKVFQSVWVPLVIICEDFLGLVGGDENCTCRETFAACLDDDIWCFGDIFVPIGFLAKPGCHVVSVCLFFVLNHLKHGGAGLTADSPGVGEQ